jgi:hypothetical protein
MGMIEIEEGKHWYAGDHGFPAGYHITEQDCCDLIGLNTEIDRWMDQNHIIYRLLAKKYDDWFDVNIEFKRPDHEMLFKLTWM